MSELVQTPAPNEEQPRLGVTIAIAIACFALGVAVVSTLPVRDKAPTKTSRPNRVAPPVVTARTGHDALAIPPVATTPARTTATSPTEAAVATQAAPTSPSPTSPSPTLEPAPATPSVAAEHPRLADNNLTMIQGRIAYLRCDGLRNERGRFPCPRDAALEQAVWDVLATLPRCSPSLGRGGVDVRLDLVRGEPTQVRVLTIAGSPEPSLDNDRVYACVGNRLAHLSTSLDPIYMMVSFRAALR